ncbi:MAG TPA: hypothetical protein VFN71_11950, partial [Methylomirabilota bacterium]|nr:hypothetical protein [Methylomirabilota bacterium]
VLVRDVRLLIEGRDASGRVVSSRAGQVVGDVAPSGRIPFCLMAEAGAAQYSVRLLDARSAPAGGQ